MRGSGSVLWLTSVTVASATNCPGIENSRSGRAAIKRSPAATASAFARSARRRHAQEVILVGIDTTGRRRLDLTPPMRAKLEVDPEHEGGGGAPEFRAWLAGKAIPLIENQFRGNGQVFLIGHSLGGLFALETLGDHELTVSGVAAISPALWWDEDAPLQRLVATLPTSDDLPPIFLVVADEDPDLMRSVITLKDALSGHDLLYFEDRAQQDHGTIVPSVLLQIGPCLWPVPPDPPNEAE